MKGFNYYFDNQFLIQEQDSKEMYIKEGEGFKTPSNFNIDLQLPNQYKLKENRDFIKNMSRYFYKDLVEEKDIVREEYLKNEEELDQEQKQIKSFYEDVLKEINVDEIPGYSLVQKSINFLEILLEKKEEDRKKNPSSPEKADATNSLPGNKSGDSISSVTKEDLAKTVQFIKENKIEEDEDVKDLVQTNSHSRKYFNKPINLKLLNRISILEGLSKEFKIEITKTEKEVSHSKDTKIKKMTTFNQLPKTVLQEYVLPTFKIKLAQKDLMCRIPIERNEGKQKIIVLIDCSGE